MGTLIQKKFSISREQKRFLEDYRKWGFSDQSSIVRNALNQFIREFMIKERRGMMEKKARELAQDYNEDKELTFRG
ncbi:MAG: hypothetical protein KAR13_06985 [Desulfobulbaceae bacterium]|nr:hypothetical protein [Desulfobulbaceae bacterium]